MSPADLKAARRELGLSQAGLAALLRVQSDRTVRKWEAAERDIPGSAAVLIEVLLAVPEARRHLLPLDTAPASPRL